MPEKIRMNYPKMEAMANQFGQGSEQLKSTKKAMTDVAATLEGGALLGQAGQEFAEGIRNRLCPSIEKLDQKFLELQKDVKEAMEKMKAADSEAKGRVASAGR